MKKMVGRIILSLCLICSLLMLFHGETAHAWATDTLYTIYTGGYFEGTNNQSGAINMYVATITLRTSTTRCRLTYTNDDGSSYSVYYMASDPGEDAQDNVRVAHSFMITVYPNGESIKLDEITGAVSIGWPSYDGMECNVNEGTPGTNPNDMDDSNTQEENEAAALLEKLNLDGLFSGAGIVLYSAKTVSSITGENGDKSEAVKYLNNIFNNRYEVGEENLPLMLDYKATEDGNLQFRIIFPKEEGSSEEKSELKKFFSSDDSWTDYKNTVDYLVKTMEQAEKAKKELASLPTDVKKKAEEKINNITNPGNFTLSVGGKKVIKGSTTFASFIKPDLSANGYMEIITDPEFHILSGIGRIVGKATSNPEPYIRQYIRNIGAIPVPYYWAIDFDYDGTINMGLKMEHNTSTGKNTFYKSADSSIYGNGKLLGQVGVGLVGIANINGNLDMNIHAEMYPNMYMGTNGTIWMSARVLNYYRKPFFEPYSFNNVLWNEKNVYDIQEESANSYLSVEDYSIIDNAEAWKGSGEEEYSVYGNNVTGALLQSGTMPGSRPQIVTVGDKEVMVYLTMMESGSANAGRLMYSVKEDGVWSEPKTVWDNGKTDYYADMKIINDSLYLTWQKAGESVDGENAEEQLLNAISGSEICFAKFDVETAEFIGQTYVTNNAYADILPQIISDSDVPAIAWIENENNAIDGIATPNVIRYTKLVNEEWAEPAELTSVNGMIGNYAVYASDGEYNSVYSLIDMSGLDEDASPQTALYVTDAEGDKILEEAQSSVVGVKYAGGAVYWLDGQGQFKRMTTSDGKITVLAGSDDDVTVGADFTVVSNSEKTAVISSGATMNGYELKTSLVNKDTLTNPYRMYEREESTMFSYDVAIDSEGRYDIIVDDEFDHDTEHNGIAEVVKEVTETLEVSGIFMSDINRDENNNQSIKLLVTNAGETPVKEIYVKVAAGNIVYLNNKKFQKTINAGESAELSTSFLVNKIQQPTTFTVSVYAEGQSEEDAWTYTTELGYTDVELTAKKQIDENKQRIQYKVTNNSDSITSGTVKVYDDFAMENLVAELSFDSLGKGETNYLYYNFNKDEITFSEDGLISYQAVLETDVYDSKQADNSAVIAVYESDFVRDDEVDETGGSEEAGDEGDKGDGTGETVDEGDKGDGTGETVDEGGKGDGTGETVDEGDKGDGTGETVDENGKGDEAGGTVDEGDKGDGTREGVDENGKGDEAGGTVDENGKGDKAGEPGDNTGKGSDAGGSTTGGSTTGGNTTGENTTGGSTTGGNTTGGSTTGGSTTGGSTTGGSTTGGSTTGGSTTGGSTTGGSTTGGTTTGGSTTDNTKVTVPTVSKVKSFKSAAGSKRLVLTWKKQSGISGYEIEYSTSKTFKKAKTINVKPAKKSYTLKKLKANKKYYVRIRAYKTYTATDKSTKKAYGKWVKLNKKTK